MSSLRETRENEQQQKLAVRQRVRSQVACIRMLLDEIDRLRSSATPGVNDVLIRSVTMQLFEEIERLEVLLKEVEEIGATEEERKRAVFAPRPCIGLTSTTIVSGV